MDLRFYRDEAWLIFDNKEPCNTFIEPKKMPHYKIWEFMLDSLKEKGFKYYVNWKFRRDYECLLPRHRFGVKNKLQFESEIYPAGFKVEFFQNINRKNKSGGKYDFNKYKMMPKHHKAMFNAITRQLIKELMDKYHLKFYDQSEITYPPLTAKQKIIKHIRECSFTRFNIESLDEIKHYMSDYDYKYNSDSGVGDKLKCSQKRRYKDWDDKHHTGIIYHNINNMWWAIRSKYKYNNIPSMNIFEVVK